MITRGDIDGLARGIALGAGLGRLPVAPGSWASLASLPLGWGAHSLGGFPGLAGLTILLFLSGLWAVRRTAGDGDPPEIVIDEIAGQLLALWPVSLALVTTGAEVLELWPGWVTAFVLFRLFDILKPWPVALAHRRHGPLWVMLDDLIAGALAATVLFAAGFLVHGFGN